MHNSQACEDFVANTDAGVPTQDDMDIFAATLSNADDSEKQIPHADYDDGYSRDDWKYDLSGGDYGNHPDSDDAWNAYWDC